MDAYKRSAICMRPPQGYARPLSGSQACAIEAVYACKNEAPCTASSWNLERHEKAQYEWDF